MTGVPDRPQEKNVHGNVPNAERCTARHHTETDYRCVREIGHRGNHTAYFRMGVLAWRKVRA